MLGIGNALVDVLSHEDDRFLSAHGLVKGGMSLADADRAHAAGLVEVGLGTPPRSKPRSGCDEDLQEAVNL